MKNSILALTIIVTSLVTSCSKQKFYKAIDEQTFVKESTVSSDSTLSIFSHVTEFEITDKKSLFFVSDVNPLGVSFRSQPSSDASKHNFVRFEKIKGSKEMEMIFDKDLDWALFTEATPNVAMLNESKFYVTVDSETMTLRHTFSGIHVESYTFTKQ